MNIYEAAKSGKKFRRENWIDSTDPTYFCFPEQFNNPKGVILTLEDLCAEDWEVETQQVLIDKDDMWYAFQAGVQATKAAQKDWVGYRNHLQEFKEYLKTLGFDGAE